MQQGGGALVGKAAPIHARKLPRSDAQYAQPIELRESPCRPSHDPRGPADFQDDAVSAMGYHITTTRSLSHMPQPTTCRDTFNAARTQRTKHPLTKGRYKLDEARHAIEDWRATVETITERVRTGSKFGTDENLGSCMSYERGAFLKELPQKVAELVGYHILPGIAALEGDGVKKAEVQGLLSRAETDAQRLIAGCEALRLRLKDGIEHEYRAMRQSESHLSGLLEDARALAQVR
jgi:hypothetical protein